MQAGKLAVLSVVVAVTTLLRLGLGQAAAPVTADETTPDAELSADLQSAFAGRVETGSLVARGNQIGGGADLRLAFARQTDPVARAVSKSKSRPRARHQSSHRRSFQPVFSRLRRLSAAVERRAGTS
jgi:hypothetical protein